MDDETVAIKVSKEARDLLVATVRPSPNFGIDPANVFAHLLRAVYDGLPASVIA